MLQTHDLDKMRHSCAHLMAAAVTELFPNAKIGIGPTIEDGFYYDFDFPKDKKITDKDLIKIEKRMEELKSKDLKLEQSWVSINEAKNIFKNQPYKLEIIDEVEKGIREDFGKKGKVSIYKLSNFIDLCKGPHVESTGQIGFFKLLSLAGAYWKGNSENQMLTRIYGTCFDSVENLGKYLRRLELAKQIDHRKIGEQQELFAISDKVGQGLILWLPKGNIIKEQLENWTKEVEKDWGYLRVTTPHITKSGLYYTSGHLPYYKKDMYPPMKFENGEEYFLKPMNCPHHHMIYASKPRSYRELPLRLAEYGTCYRYESSGELFGLMRVRGFTQNDAHIYCSVDQAVDEFVAVMKLHEFYYKILGIKKYHLELSLRDPKDKEKYHGDEEMWQLSEKLMREAVKKTNIEMVEKIGGAAFYGPKIDFIIHSAVGREFAISTNQIDLFMGKRFGLKYTDKDGQEKVPVIIHRAPLGSHERFIGFLIEHYIGVFPLWLAPVQLAIVPVSDKHLELARIVYNKLSEQNFRVEIDEEAKTVGYKIRKYSLQKIPYTIIIGDKETAQSRSKEIFVSVRTREGKDLGLMKLQEFIESLKAQIEKYA